MENQLRVFWVLRVSWILWGIESLLGIEIILGIEGIHGTTSIQCIEGILVIYNLSQNTLRPAGKIPKF